MNLFKRLICLFSGCDKRIKYDGASNLYYVCRRCGKTYKVKERARVGLYPREG